jgi:hypothetical protein
MKKKRVVRRALYIYVLMHFRFIASYRRTLVPYRSQIRESRLLLALGAIRTGAREWGFFVALLWGAGNRRETPLCPWPVGARVWGGRAQPNFLRRRGPECDAGVRAAALARRASSPARWRALTRPTRNRNSWL